MNVKAASKICFAISFSVIVLVVAVVSFVRDYFCCQAENFSSSKLKVDFVKISRSLGTNAKRALLLAFSLDGRRRSAQDAHAGIRSAPGRPSPDRDPAVWRRCHSDHYLARWESRENLRQACSFCRLRS